MVLGPALYALLLGAGVPAWYDPWSDAFLAYDRAACEAGTRSLESCSNEQPQAEASQESYFAQPKDTRTSWWLQEALSSQNTLRQSESAE